MCARLKRCTLLKQLVSKGYLSVPWVWSWCLCVDWSRTCMDITAAHWWLRGLQGVLYEVFKFLLSLIHSCPWPMICLHQGTMYLWGSITQCVAIIYGACCTLCFSCHALIWSKLFIFHHRKTISRLFYFQGSFVSVGVIDKLFMKHWCMKMQLVCLFLKPFLIQDLCVSSCDCGKFIFKETCDSL